MSKKYQYWRNALKGEFGPVHDGDPQLGFYRNQSKKHNIDQPVAIWFDEKSGNIVARIGFDQNAKMIDPDEIWTFVCRNPLSSDVYQSSVKRGSFNDAPAPMGHNLPDDPLDAIKMKLEIETDGFDLFIESEITDELRADKAAAWAIRLNDISKDADNQRKVLKQPHSDAAKAIDAQWNPVRDDAKDRSARLKNHLNAYLQEQHRIEQERKRKAEQEAEKARLEAEEAAREAEQSGDENAAEIAKIARENADKAKREAKERNPSAGKTGSKVALRTHVFAEVTDFDVLLQELKDRTEIKELVQNLANRAARSGVEIKGMKIKEEKKAA